MKKRGLYDVFMFLAGVAVLAAVLLVGACADRDMSPWPFVWWCLGSAGVFLLAALIAHEGRDVLALPQAAWMALQDRRERRNVNSDSVRMHDD